MGVLLSGAATLVITITFAVRLSGTPATAAAETSPNNTTASDSVNWTSSEVSSTPTEPSEIPAAATNITGNGTTTVVSSEGDSTTFSTSPSSRTTSTAATDTTNPGTEGEDGFSLSQDMQWALLAVLAVLIILAILVACFLWKQSRGKGCSRCHVAKEDESSCVEEGANVSFTDLLQVEEGGISRCNAKPVHAVKPQKKGTGEGGEQEQENNTSDTSSPNAPGPPPNPRKRTNLRLSPDGEENGTAVTPDEKGGGGGRGQESRNRKSVYSIFRQSLATLNDVQDYLIDRLEFGQLAEDFKNIPVSISSLSHDVASLPENKKKNRFTSVLPYDKNRVVLTDGYTEDDATDYINASYIDGYRTKKTYIAAQGPRETTTGDFWRMIWQENVTHIVMLTNLKERGRDKCYQYWPKVSGQNETYGPVSVTMNCVEKRATFTIRNFSVTTAEDSTPREVIQYHYVAWPDFGVPLTASLVSFWRYVTRMRREDGSEELPLLVHCSAGVGRSGTFIGLDIAMQQCVTECKVDLLELVTSLRHQRCLMVQAASQFEFLHTALLEAYTSKDSIIPVDKMSSMFTSPIVASQANARIDTEFRLLMEMKYLSEEMVCSIARKEANRLKNRDPDLLPVDDHLAFLNEYADDRGEYINAVYMPTFHGARGSLVTQLPLPSTLVDFWTLVYGNCVTTIVSLSSPNEEETVNPSCQYWPLGGEDGEEVMDVDPYSVRFLSVTTVAPALQSYSLSVSKKGVSESCEVELLHYTGWTGRTGGDVSDILYVVDTLKSLGADQTCVVQCQDGVRKSGLFCALCDVIARMTYDQEVDVYMSVRHIQSVSPHAVSSLIQYRYLYEVAQRRSEELSLYVNQAAIASSPAQ